MKKTSQYAERVSRLSQLAVVAYAIVASLAMACSSTAAQHEQTTFGIESEIEHPLPLPKQVLNILGKDARVSECAKREGFPEAKATMFVASQIHLRSGEQSDLVVLPKDACLFGANIGPIWVFAKSPGAYQLILKTDALGIEVLTEKSNAYRDIRGTQATANRILSATFKFDGHVYQPAH
ncbi:MAG TPA: hypothetical protein VKR82_06930 [Candidatus Acidoferrales bacterium]|nr:hypothetical protein [Candidatus Acidoferrales bacterium]